MSLMMRNTSLPPESRKNASVSWSLKRSIKSTLKWSARITFFPFWCLLWLITWVTEKDNNIVGRTPFFWPPFNDRKFDAMLGYKYKSRHVLASLPSDREVIIMVETMSKDEIDYWIMRHDED